MPRRQPIARCASCAGRAVRPGGGIDSADSRCPPVDRRMRSTSTAPNWRPDADAALRRARSTSIETLAARRLKREPVARILGRKEFWSLALQRHACRAGAAAGNRNRDRGRARYGDDARPAHGKTARPRHRHRLGSAVAGDAQRIAERHRYRHRHQRRCAWRSRAPMPSASAGRHAAPSSPATSPAASSGPFDFILSNPPYIAQWRYRIAARRRCATTTRGWRSKAAPTGSIVTARLPAERPRLLASGGRLIVELGAGQDDAVQRAVYQGGLERRR